MTNEEIIANFLKAISEWVEVGCPYFNHYGFLPSSGLCTNLTIYCYNNLLNFEDTLNVEGHLKQMFNGRGHYPFNNTGEDYFEEIGEETLYLNPKRLAFIKQHKAN